MMKRSFLRKMFAEKKTLVVDLTHGGRTLGRMIEGYPGAEVILYDLYGADKGSRIPDFDLCVSPVHSPVMNPILEGDDRVISHHRAVGYILKSFKDSTGCRIVEVTGTRGKTSVAMILKYILTPGLRVLSSTSSGLDYTDREGTILLKERGSITPSHALDAMEIAKERGLTVDIALFEVSLGFTGAADLNILTSLEGDYPIAGGKLSATAAKRFTMRGLDVIEKGVIEAENSRLFGRRQQENLSLACLAASKLGVSERAIKNRVSNLSQVRSRMEVVKSGDWVVIDDRNPASDAFNLQSGIDEIMEMEGDRIVLIGGSRRSNCSQIDLEAIIGVLDRYRDRVTFYLYGEIGEDLTACGLDHPFLAWETDDEVLEDVRARSDENKGVILLAGRPMEGWRWR